MKRHTYNFRAPLRHLSNHNRQLLKDIRARLHSEAIEFAMMAAHRHHHTFVYFYGPHPDCNVAGCRTFHDRRDIQYHVHRLDPPIHVEIIRRLMRDYLNIRTSKAN